jgi:hypothetical protein
LIALTINAQNLIPFEKDKLWGYKDSQGNVKIAPQYDYALKFTFNYGVVLKNDSVGAIDENNNIVIPIKYDFVRPLDSTEFLFGYKAKYFGEYFRGIITVDRKIKIPPVYRDITKRNECYEVRKQVDSITGRSSYGDLRSAISSYGLLDSNGQILIPCEYDYLSWLNDSLLDLSKANNHALFNKLGKQLTEFIYMVISKSTEEGLFKVRIENKYGFIDYHGKIAIPIEFNFCEDFHNGFSIIQKNKWGAIDRNGRTVIEPKYEYQEVKKMLNLTN